MPLCNGRLGSFLPWFYQRRIRRLIPPAIPVIAFTAFVGWQLLPTSEFTEYARSLAAYSAFSSNWFFLHISGYFDGPSHFKPLLHTWSLSVEEQFYLLFPIPMLLLKKTGRKTVVVFLTVIVLSSLAYSIYLMAAGNSADAFYNSFARFWEIGVGALLAVAQRGEPEAGPITELAGVSGLLLIIASMLAYGGTIPFPGLSALIPTVGTALVIWSSNSIANRFLSWRPLVAVGLVSYALYLWHWPIFVYIRYQFIGSGPLYYLIGSAVSLSLAVLSYFLIEQPVRKRRILPFSTQIGAAFTISLILCIALSVQILRHQGYPERFPKAAEYGALQTNLLAEHYVKRLRSKCWISSKEDLLKAIDTCVKIDPNKTNVLLVGDSHAAQLFHGLHQAWGDINVDLLATDSCTFRRTALQACNDLTDWLVTNASMGTLPYDHIVITTRIGKMPEAVHMADFATQLSSYGADVTLLGPIQFYQPNLPTLYPRLAGRVEKDRMLELFTEAVQPTQFMADAYFRERFKNSTEVSFVSLLQYTCPQGPKSCAHLDSEGLPVTVDDSHLTVRAADNLVKAILPALAAHFAVEGTRKFRAASNGLPPVAR